MIILVFLIIFKVLFLTFPQAVLEASREGLILWLNNIIPALFPFMILVNMLVSMGFAQVIGRFMAPFMKNIFNLPGSGGFALVTGLTSGYPMGAKAVAGLIKSGQVSACEGRRLLAFCNNAGPLFILGAVGVGLFRSAAAGYILWAGHVLSAIILGVLLRFLPPYERELPHGPAPAAPPVARDNWQPLSPEKALGDAVKNAMEAMAMIGGLVIFFSAVTAALKETIVPAQGYISGLVTGLIEVSGGAERMAAYGVTLPAMGGAAFIIAFGGLSVHMQTLHFTEGAGIKANVYLAHKLLHGLLAAAVTIFICVIANFAVK